MAEEKKEVKEEKKDPKEPGKDTGKGKSDSKGKKGKGKGKRSKSKRGRNDESREPGKNKADNDATWYKKYPSLVQAASSIIFNQPFGYSPAIVTPDATGIDVLEDNSSIPGVVAYKYLPMYVEDATEQSAVNIATKNLYTYIRHANSGSANYESSDLMQYLITVMGLIVAVEQCKRDLRLVPTFNPLNRYVFGAALRAVGYSEANITVMRRTQALNVASLNQIISQLNSFKVPKDFSLLDRHVWLVSNIWKDDNLEKSSYYLFYNNVIPHYDWANRKVEVHDVGSLDLPSKLDAIQNEINNLFAYEDIGIMLGDILKAYKQEGCRVIDPIQMGEVCDAGYSSEALMQFTNAFIFGASKFDYEIIQNTANSQLLEMASTGHPNGHLVIEVPSLSTTVPTITGFDYKPVLTIDDDSPDSDKVIIATRFMIAGRFTKGTGNKYIYDSVEFPTEIILDANIWYYTRSGNSTPILTDKSFHTLNIAVHSTRTVNSDDTNEFISELQSCALLDKISFNPNLVFIRNDVEDIDSDKICAINYKFLGKNWIPVESEWLNRLTKGCKQSLYTLPMFKLLESN